MAGLEAAGALAESLLARGAIPSERLKFFIDPECNPGGRGKSRADVFEKNGTAGAEILVHPHFLKHLRYFIYGPALPAEVIKRFTRIGLGSMYFDSDDADDLKKECKALIRDFGLDPYEVADEFMKLALECGAAAGHAVSIREAVRKLRLTR